jgi:hypothetical protein
MSEKKTDDAPMPGGADFLFFNLLDNIIPYFIIP